MEQRSDTGMVTKHIDQSHGGTPQQYANDLVAEIKVCPAPSVGLVPHTSDVSLHAHVRPGHSSPRLRLGSAAPPRQKLCQSGPRRVRSWRGRSRPSSMHTGPLRRSPRSPVLSSGRQSPTHSTAYVAPPRPLNAHVPGTDCAFEVRRVRLHDRRGSVQRDILRECDPGGESYECRIFCRFSADSACAWLQIDLQLAKQGFRLAAWLNVLFDGATKLP